MKKITLVILLAIAGVNFSSAQTQYLYGTCYGGGAYNWGSIFQANLDGSNLHTAYSFTNPEGAMPWGRIAQAANGKIYGVTFLGGCADSCTLWEYDPIINTCIDVYDFYCNPPIGEPSQGGLIVSPDHFIYGTQQNGILYKFDPNAHVYTLLNQTSGAYYYGGLLQWGGTLYGVSYMGGTYSHGYIFKYDLTTQTYSNLYSFDGTHGGNPYYLSLIRGADGKLYGTTQTGGANNLGVIFSYDLASNVYTDLYDFQSSQGHSPYAGVMQATNGKLYGMTYQGGTSNYGTIYSFDIVSSQYTELYNFDGASGSNPMRTLTQASNGKLFGTTYNGGLNNAGTAFSYDIATATYTKLADFSAAMGSGPQSDMQEMTVQVTEGIASASASSLSVYVDASNQLVVQGADKGNLIVFDGQGKNVFQSEIVNQKSDFDMSAYPRGIYFVQVKADGKIVTQKVILSK